MTPFQHLRLELRHHHDRLHALAEAGGPLALQEGAQAMGRMLAFLGEAERVGRAFAFFATDVTDVTVDEVLAAEPDTADLRAVADEWLSDVLHRLRLHEGSPKGGAA